MKRDQLYLSTISTDAVCVAQEYNLGLEIAEYCTAWNMDEKFANVDSIVKEKQKKTGNCMFHAPYNELFPCAIDKKARELAEYRYRQAIRLAKSYGAQKVHYTWWVPSNDLLSCVVCRAINPLLERLFEKRSWCSNRIGKCLGRNA